MKMGAKSTLKSSTCSRLEINHLYSLKRQGPLQHLRCWKPICFESRAHSCITQACKEDPDISSCNQRSKDGGMLHTCVLLKSAKVPGGGLAKAARYMCNDAMFVSAAAQTLDERARNDLMLLSQEFSRLDVRARQDMALLGLGFLKLDARAREDAEKLDTRARKKVQRLKHIAMGFKELAGTELKIAAIEHWNDGGLEADLRLADLRARRRALEDSFATFQAVKSVHAAVAKALLSRSMRASQTAESCEVDAARSFGKEIEVDPVRDPASLQDLHCRVSSVVTDFEGDEYADPDELKFIVAMLLDMDEVDGASGASLLMQSASSPDVATRLALADALADAPFIWNLGNAGLCALQRLAKDSNVEVALAARRALEELQHEWQHGQGALLFPRDIIAPQSDSSADPDSDA